MASLLVASLAAPSLTPRPSCSSKRFTSTRSRGLTTCSLGNAADLTYGLSVSASENFRALSWAASSQPASYVSSLPSDSLQEGLSGLHNSLGLLAELSPQNAELIATVLGPVLAVLNVLFIFRIVMSWYPQLPVKDFPYNIAYVPTEPLLAITRRVVEPIGGVDVSPVIWLAFFSFMNEILLGQQGLLILISQQQI